jgi:hypothetical protein
MFAGSSITLLFTPQSVVRLDEDSPPGLRGRGPWPARFGPGDRRIQPAGDAADSFQEAGRKDGRAPGRMACLSRSV